MIKLYSGQMETILEKHPSDVLVNFTDADGTSHHPLGRILYRDYPEYTQMVDKLNDSHITDYDGIYGFQKDSKGVIHVAGFISQLTEKKTSSDLLEQNPKLVEMLRAINMDMVVAGQKSITMQHYGDGTGYNFADFLTLIETIFDPKIIVRLVTSHHIAKYCQLPHYHYPTEDEKDIL